MASKEFAYEQYDKQVGAILYANQVFTGVVRVEGTKKQLLQLLMAKLDIFSIILMKVEKWLFRSVS